MKKKDLLDLLEDIVEEDGDLIRLKGFYVEKRNIKLDAIQKIIIYGLKIGILQLFQHVNPNKKNAKAQEYYEKINLDKSISIVNDQKSWDMFPNGYEVSFIDIDKYLWILLNNNDQKIPEEFIQFIME